MEQLQTIRADLFRKFLESETLSDTLDKYNQILNLLKYEPSTFENFYHALRRLVYADPHIKAFYDDLSRKTRNKVYFSARKTRGYLKGSNCLIVGGGPCGQRVAIELQLLGAKVLIVEKRGSDVVNNNFVHLWPFVIHDLKELGCKRLHPKIDFTTCDYIQVKKLELLLLKVALVLGCDYVNNVLFESICPLSLKTNNGSGSCCCAFHLDAKSDPGAYGHFQFYKPDRELIEKLNRYSFNIIIDAGGKHTVIGKSFTQKKLTSKLEIVITCNFINKNSKATRFASLLSSVESSSHPHLFQNLYELTGVDLVNYCLYRSESYLYLVMIPKKKGLVDKKVLIEDKEDIRELFSPENINNSQLLEYVKTAGTFLTGLDDLEFASNSTGQIDCKIFNYTSSASSSNACCIKEIVIRSKCCKRKEEPKYGSMLVGLCGDSLIDSFWPIGSTPGRGFFSALDTAWTCKQFGMNRLHTFGLRENENDLLRVIAEREAIYQFLPLVSSQNIIQTYNDYTINPATRYKNYKSIAIEPHKYRHLLNPKIMMKDGTLV